MQVNADFASANGVRPKIVFVVSSISSLFSSVRAGPTSLSRSLSLHSPPAPHIPIGYYSTQSPLGGAETRLTLLPCRTLNCLAGETI